MKPLTERGKPWRCRRSTPTKSRASTPSKRFRISTGIPEEEFIGAFKIAEEDFEKPIGKSADREGSGSHVEAVREFVRERQGK